VTSVTEDSPNEGERGGRGFHGRLTSRVKCPTLPQNEGLFSERALKIILASPRLSRHPPRGKGEVKRNEVLGRGGHERKGVYLPVGWGRRKGETQTKKHSRDVAFAPERKGDEEPLSSRKRIASR